MEALLKNSGSRNMVSKKILLKERIYYLLTDREVWTPREMVQV